MTAPCAPIPTSRKNCSRCGHDFASFGKELICTKCRKPKVNNHVTIPAVPSIDAPLTLRERQLCDLLLTGDPNKIIAHHLHLTPNTVSTYLSKIYLKTGITSRVELAVQWARKKMREAEAA